MACACLWHQHAQCASQHSCGNWARSGSLSCGHAFQKVTPVLQSRPPCPPHPSVHFCQQHRVRCCAPAAAGWVLPLRRARRMVSRLRGRQFSERVESRRRSSLSSVVTVRDGLTVSAFRSKKTLPGSPSKAPGRTQRDPQTHLLAGNQVHLHCPTRYAEEHPADRPPVY